MIRCGLRLASTALALADLAALLALLPDPAALVHDLAAPRAWLAEVGADAAAATLAGAGLWCMAAWVGLGLLAAFVTRAPGRLGRLADAVARTLLPKALYRALSGAVGLGVLLAPAAAGAQVVAAPHVGAAGPPSTPSATIPAPGLPAPTWPTTASKPVPTVPVPVRLPAPTLPHAAHRSSEAAGVTVRSGDSLWRIAAARLGDGAAAERIAAAWPRWYAANRSVIGPDPDLIRPGERLQPPAPNASRP